MPSVVRGSFLRILAYLQIQMTQPDHKYPMLQFLLCLPSSLKLRRTGCGPKGAWGEMFFLLLLSFVFSLAGCVRIAEVSQNVSPYQPPAAALSEPVPGPSLRLIRVAIAVRRPSVHLVSPETFVLSGFPMDGTPVIQKGRKSYHEATLTSDQLYAHKAYIEPLGEGDIQVDGKSYRGSMEIVEDLKGTLTVINELPLEEYVMGVLAGEIPRNWPAAALEAQAIAARTFAVLTQSEARRRGEPYDLENTALFQMYQGSGLVNDNIRQAVLKSTDEIVTYRSSPIMAFFHSNCGGETCGAMEVWSKNQPYLRPVECTFGNNGAHFRWRTEIRVKDLVRNLRKAGMDIGDVTRLEPLSRDESGRITELAIMDENGKNHKMRGSAFRMAVGPDVIRSTRFNASVAGDNVVFTGKGWGHGVGLCQEGACGMALKGYSAFDILRHYYQGIMVEKLSDQF